MANRSVLVRVPATVGNFGGAMNCAALALNAALNLKVTTRQDGQVGIRYFGDNGQRVPRDGSNLVVRAFKAALAQESVESTGADFEIYSSVPVGVGLGSSTAAVLAGLLAADRLFHLEFEEKALFQLAGRYENRGDNLRAAWTGGFVASVAAAAGARAGEGAEPSYRWTVVPEGLVLSVVLPSATSTLTDRQGSSSTQVAAVKQSLYHQRAGAWGDFMAEPWHRPAPSLATALPEPSARSVPGLEEALEVRTPGLTALFVCGAGPAVGILAERDAAEAAVAAVSDCFAWHGVAWTTAEFRPTNTGAREWNSATASVVAPSPVGLDMPLPKVTHLPA